MELCFSDLTTYSSLNEIRKAFPFPEPLLPMDPISMAFCEHWLLNPLPDEQINTKENQVNHILLIPTEESYPLFVHFLKKALHSLPEHLTYHLCLDHLKQPFQMEAQQIKIWDKNTECAQVIHHGVGLDQKNIPPNLYHFPPLEYGLFPELKIVLSKHSLRLVTPSDLKTKRVPNHHTLKSSANLLPRNDFQIVFNFLPNQQILEHYSQITPYMHLPSTQVSKGYFSYQSGQELITNINQHPPEKLLIFLRPALLSKQELNKMSQTLIRGEQLIAPLSTSKKAFLSNVVPHMNLDEIPPNSNWTPENLRAHLRMLNTDDFIRVPEIDSPVFFVGKTAFKERQKEWATLSKSTVFQKIILKDCLAVELEG